MICEIMPIENIPSVYLQTEYSILICKLSYTQKNESDPFINIQFKMKSTTEENNIVKSVIEKIIKNKCSVTQINIEFVEIKKGVDILSVYINAFGAVAKLANLDVMDDIIAGSFTKGEYQACVTYLVKEKTIINLYFNGPVDLKEVMSECEKEAEKNEKFLKLELKKFYEKK
ncbi:putative exosome complex exonuclease [Vairimorpha necatrix]|uniref:Exosome complex exonuclease n=1 Tax=Vairimorpha necatrix TaxID=6039 RepID=A0AAX4JGJ4_9MICR